jgi:hypothetical protein
VAGAFVAQREDSVGTTGENACDLGATYTPTAGNLIIAVVSYFSATSRTITWPTAWATIEEAGNFHNGTDGAGARWGIFKNVAAAASNASVSFVGGTVDFPGIYIAEWSGLATTGTLIAAPALSRQAAPGTGAGAIAVSATPSVQPAIVFGISWCVGAAANWDTAVSDSGRTRAWDYGGASFGAKPQDARVVSTSAKTLTWTTNTGAETYYSIAMALAEPGAGGGGAVKRNNLALMGAGR